LRKNADPDDERRQNAKKEALARSASFWEGNRSEAPSDGSDEPDEPDELIEMPHFSIALITFGAVLVCMAAAFLHPFVHVRTLPACVLGRSPGSWARRAPSSQTRPCLQRSTNLCRA
jgi:hypothetical protein